MATSKHGLCYSKHVARVPHAAASPGAFGAGCRRWGATAAVLMLLVGFAAWPFSTGVAGAGEAVPGSWSALGSGVGIPGAAAAISFDARLVVGGAFDSVSYQIPADGVAQWDGSNWSQVGNGLGTVRALVVQDSHLIAGGTFGSGDGGGQVASWDGSQWISLTSGWNSTVFALATLNDELIAGGAFYLDAGTPGDHIARWDGNSWSNLGGGVDGWVYALTVYQGDLIAGGSFVHAGGIAASHIARWDGKKWSPIATTMNGSVYALAVYRGDLIVAGRFQNVDGVSASRIARWDGSTWFTLDSGVNGYLNQADIYALAVYDDRLIVGGDFSEAGSIAAHSIASWDGEHWSRLGGDIASNGKVDVLATHEESLIVGGRFDGVDGIDAFNVAEWRRDPVYADGFEAN